MDKLLVFGGTFNPIHNGHIRLYRHFADALDARRVLIIPAHIPPHKSTLELADGGQRMEMCRLATKDDDRVIVSDLELRRDGPSYTYDTLRAVAAKYPGTEICLIVGSDMLFTLNSWHKAAEVMRMATICALPRHSGEYGALSKRALEWEQAFGGRFFIEDVSALDISSTQLREMVKRGEDTSLYLPPEVEAYIKRNGIYGNADG